MTVQVTEVTPIGKLFPEGALLPIDETPHSSSTSIGVPKSTSEEIQDPSSALTVTSPCKVNVGFILSLNVTNCVAVDMFPEVSLAVHVIVVVPVGNFAGALFENV